MLATMTFIAGTAMGMFMVSQHMRAEERQNRDAILFIQAGDAVDQETRVIFRNGLIVESFEDGRPDRRVLMSNADLESLELVISRIDTTRVTREITYTDREAYLERVFSVDLNRWVTLIEHRGRNIYRTASDQSSEVIEFLEYIFDKYLSEADVTED